MNKLNKLFFLTALMALSLTACNSVKTVTTEAPPQDSQQKTAAVTEPADKDKDDIDLPATGTAMALPDAIEFVDKSNNVLFKYTHGKDSGQVLGADGKVLLKFKQTAQKGSKILTVADGAGKPVGSVQLADINTLKIKDANHNELYKLRFEKESHHYKLKDAHDKVLYKLKEEAYGLKIEEGDNSDKALYKVKVKEDKVKLKSADGSTVLMSKMEVQAPVVAVFGFDALPKEQQYALSFALEYMRF